jgi:UDP-glucose/iron transport system ATP-binding protein
VPDEGVTVVIGPSGSGKTTLLRLCNRLEVPDAGCVRFRGDDVAGLDPLALRRQVGMVFQRPTVFAGTVRENLAVAAADLDDEGACAALAHADLPPSFLDRPAHELSGGEGQRVCLARTLAAHPEVLLMDEPTSSIDERSTKVLEELARQRAADGTPVVWVTHDLAQMRRLADHVLVLADGRVVHAGPPDSVPKDSGEA